MNICAVLVTFNRKLLLQQTLQFFDNLESPPDSIVIVDNHSTDGTDEVVKQWQKTTCYKHIHYIYLEQNLGGSGGFHEGMKFAQTLNPDWIWLSDDDAFPEPDCFTIIRKKIQQINSNEYAAICGAVINNGQIDEQHRRKLVKKTFTIKEQIINKTFYQQNEFSLDLFSYVGVVINNEVLKKAGLTEKDYFIWYDDSEHSWRLSLYGKIICLPAARVNHNITEDNSTLSWKAYYGARNRLLTYKKHHKLTYLKHILLLKKKIFFSASLAKNPIYKAMLIAAIRDAQQNKQGVHNIYKPGWKPNE